MPDGRYRSGSIFQADFVYIFTLMASGLYARLLDIPMTNDGCIFPFVLLECS